MDKPANHDTYRLFGSSERNFLMIWLRWISFRFRFNSFLFTFKWKRRSVFSTVSCFIGFVRNSVHSKCKNSNYSSCENTKNEPSRPEKKNLNKLKSFRRRFRFVRNSFAFPFFEWRIALGENVVELLVFCWLGFVIVSQTLFSLFNRLLWFFNVIDRRCSHSLIFDSFCIFFFLYLVLFANKSVGRRKQESPFFIFVDHFVLFWVWFVNILEEKKLFHLKCNKARNREACIVVVSTNTSW